GTTLPSTQAINLTVSIRHRTRIRGRVVQRGPLLQHHHGLVHAVPGAELSEPPAVVRVPVRPSWQRDHR
ncbi:hypothetical protein DPMN_172655, partial [Dreissena polymorpha]